MSRRFFVARRFSQSVITVFAVASLMFVIFRLSPANPTATVISPALDPSVQASMAAQYGIDQPLRVQYVRYLGNVATFDMGYSFFRNEPVRAILADRMVNTAVLMGIALFVSFSLGTLLGAFAAWRRDSSYETATLVAAVAFRSVPSFLLGLLLLYLFSFELQWLPIGHMADLDREFAGKLDLFFSWNFFKHLLLPVLSLVPFLMAYPMLLMRTTMLDVINEDYVTMCHAKGVPERRIFLNHAVRNSLLPIVTMLPIVLGVAVAGNILIETIFSWPGIGRTLVDAMTKGDYPLAQGAFLLIAVIVIFGNFVIDLVYGWLDPRITYD